MSRYLRYTVKVTAEFEEVRKAGKAWEVVGKDAKGDPAYGYTPEIEKTLTGSRSVFEQTVDSLDLGAGGSG